MASRSQSRRVIKSDVLVVGIDVARRRHVAVCRQPDGVKLRPFSFPNDRVGYETLLARAETARNRAGCQSVLFALEATGHYGHALRYFLADRGHTLVAINPAHTKHAKELEDNSPEKSDAKDAGVIADLAAQGRGRPIAIPRGVFAELRRLAKLRARLVAERSRLLHRYQGLVDLVFPELVGIVRDVTCRSIRRLLAQSPSADDIAGMSCEDLEERLRRWSHGHIAHPRIARIWAISRESIAIREGLDTMRWELRQTLASLEQVEGRIKEVEHLQVNALHRVPYAGLLLSVPHLGAVTAATILGEAGDLRMYASAEALIKFAGYNLYTIASGNTRGRTRITKRGRPLLRHQLFLASMRMSRKGAPLADLRGRLLERKPGPMIVVAGCRKLLRLLVAIVRDGVPYEPGRLARQSAA